MVINKRPDSPVETAVVLEGFAPRVMAKVAMLGGPDYLSRNDDESTFRSVTPAPPATVRIAESAFEAAGPSFRCKFPEHSITIVELQAR